jgi:predicted polyphosphate/ATP-dependent NAD kinase
MRVGLVVNPDAGLGGRLAFKGSDGRAAEARAAGAEDRAGPRMMEALTLAQSLLASPLNRTGVSLDVVGWSGRMGNTWMPTGWPFESLGDTPPSTSAETTMALVRALVEAKVDVILYAGGDGTTRDIVQALEACDGEARKLPLIGVPGGVKMHSGCFATTPEAAADVLLAFALGDLRCAVTEVMDLDEEVYLQGEWRVRMYGEAMTPASPRYMQGAKEQVERESEEETLEGMAEHLGLMMEDPDLLMVWGSGGTLRVIGEHLGLDLTLLGIDVVHGGTVHCDLDEGRLLDLIRAHEGPRLLLLSPMGGQGFLIGRGNLQLSPDVLRAIGIEHLLAVATPSKLLGLEAVRIDTGEAALDEDFRNRRFVKVLQGFRTTRVIRVHGT